MPGQYYVVHLNCAHIKKVSKAFANLAGMGTKIKCIKCNQERSVVYKTVETR